MQASKGFTGIALAACRLTSSFLRADSKSKLLRESFYALKWQDQEAQTPSQVRPGSALHWRLHARRVNVGSEVPTQIQPGLCNRSEMTLRPR
jgi:hypothetical protein